MSLRTRIFAASTFACLAFALPVSAEAADGVTRSSLDLRAGPGTDYPTVETLASGTALIIYGCNTGYQWCDVSAGDNRGWIAGSDIGVQRDGAQVTLPSAGDTVGISIVSFDFKDYWGKYYASRPFYHEARWWTGHGPMPDEHASNAQTDQAKPIKVADASDTAEKPKKAHRAHHVRHNHHYHDRLPFERHSRTVGKPRTNLNRANESAKCSQVTKNCT